MTGIGGLWENLKYFSLSFVSNLWSIWTYRNKATMNKEPLSATNSSKTKRSSDCSRIVHTFKEYSNWQPTMLDESCKGKRRKGDLVSFYKNRGPCPWLVVSAGLFKNLWQHFYWLFYEGLLKILALGFLSVSILRSNKEATELPNREAVVKDIQQFTNVWDWQVYKRFGRALISSIHCP